MAESSQEFLQSRLHDAINAVAVGFEGDRSYRSLESKDAPALVQTCAAVWSKTVNLAGKERIIYVGLTDQFPDEVPRACIADASDLVLQNPHVNGAGFICTIPDSAAVDTSDPVGLVRYVFEDAERILSGTDPSDFKDEFTSYWNHSLTKDSPPVLLIEAVDQLSNPFVAGFYKQHICVANEIKHIDRWMLQRTGHETKPLGTALGVAIRLDEPLLPTDYPNTLKQLIDLAQRRDSKTASLIRQHITKGTDKGVALLVQKEGDGFAIGAVTFTGLGLSQRTSKGFIHGFRPGNVPPDVLCSRAVALLSSAPVWKNPTERVDHQWIHSRGGDGRDLSKKSVLLLGSGSLGGYIAHFLSRAGIGNLTLTDNDRLEWDNLGRHILGSSYVGCWKSEALRQHLLRDLPHLNITAIPTDWRDAVNADPGLLSKHDVVISTVADWRCERPLNALSRNDEIPPVLFGWLEPFAVAGHCLVVGKKGGCFECGCDRFGHFLDAVAQFAKPPLSKEPGGCTHYQHYGPIALMPIASLIASVAIETALETPATSVLHTWVSGRDHFDSVRADVSPAWQTEIQSAGYSRKYRRQWCSTPTCSKCPQT